MLTAHDVCQAFVHCDHTFVCTEVMGQSFGIFAKLAFGWKNLLVHRAALLPVGLYGEFSLLVEEECHW